MKRVHMALLAMALLLSGCGKQEQEDNIPGSYTVPEGWIKWEEHSTQDQIFYVEEGHDGDQQPDNIAINVGENRYGEDEHTQFRDAILRQLMMQIGDAEVELYGEGTNTEQDYILYIFTIEDEAQGVETKQFYIVGDYRYCLVQLTNFTGAEEGAQVAQEMVDSFVWDDLEQEK